MEPNRSEAGRVNSQASGDNGTAECDNTAMMLEGVRTSGRRVSVGADKD